MPDKFDQMAREIARRNAASWACDMVGEIAAALRETDAKAREEERCARVSFEELDWQLKNAQHAAAIRDGAGECGTCWRCSGEGTSAPHSGDTRDCPSIAYIKGDPFCGCEEVPCPDCKGGDDA